jgi:hypothetical protein
LWLGQFNWPDRFFEVYVTWCGIRSCSKANVEYSFSDGNERNDMATAPVSAARREAVDRARQSWSRKLIDLSRRNNLLYYRPLKTGTLDLTSAESSGMATLLSGVEPVSIEQLLPNGKDWGFLNPNYCALEFHTHRRSPSTNSSTTHSSDNCSKRLNDPGGSG